MNWEIVSAIAAAVTAIFILAATSVAILQLRALVRQQQLSAFQQLLTEIGSLEARKRRALIYRKLPQLGVGDALPDLPEDVFEAAEMTVVTLDRVGFLLLNGFGPRRLVIAWLSGVVCAMWDRLEPYIYQWRKWEGRARHAEYFERLASEARQIR